MQRRTRLRLEISAALVVGLSLASCDQPKPRGPGTDGTVVELARLAARRVGWHGLDPAPPPPPAWSRGLIGRPLRQAFPASGACLGNTDQTVARGPDAPSGVRILGWGWDVAAWRRVGRVVLTDAKGTIIGVGEGGVPRPDVPAAMPAVTDPAAGWIADPPRKAHAVDAYGIVGAEVVCPLGHLAF